ncbi:MAG: methyltransferase [Flavipsychrobacter sp.]|nr:methyltransferase [Flavipsychrobacter sp.]
MYLTKEAKEFLSSDEAFDKLLPIYIQSLSNIHWTPLNVALMAAQFLAPDANAKVIDIGAGIGKFCIAGACCTKGTFTGIEQRKNFVTIGNKAIKKLGVANAELLHGNFTELDITSYTGVYFYNSFHENLVFEDALDNKVEMSTELYEKYSAHLLNQLNAMPVGTRLATFWLSVTEIPGCYKLKESHFNNLLKLWVKES